MKLVRILSAAAISGCSTVCLGAESESAEVSGGLAEVDWAIIVAYALGTIGLGWYYSRRQASTKEYFVGSGKMNPFLVGVSLFATLLSTITYLSSPGEALGKGPVYLTTLLSLPLVYVVVAYWLLPVYMKQKVTSAYELLEERLGLGVRMLGAVMFVTLRLIWMSLLVYLTAKAMVIMLGVGEDRIPVVALVTGFVAVIYTSLGGLRAVVITDFLQTVLLFGGALLVLALITVDLGGFGWFPTEWKSTWDTQPILPTSLSTRVTVVGSLISYLVWYVCTTGGDQTCVQRFMATEDLKAARRAYATQLAVSVLVGVVLGLVGFALLGYFEAHPDLVPDGKSLKADADKMFPHFIAFHLPVGVSGLVVAAMFAAAMSSIDSGVNSITAVVMTDGFDRLGEGELTEQQRVKLARWLAFGIGGVAVIGSSVMGRVPGNITSVTSKTSNLLTTPIFGLFFFALFVPFASPKGTLIGAFFGTLAAVLVAFGGPLVLAAHLFLGIDPAMFGSELIETLDEATGQTVLSCPDPISFQWIAPIAITINIVAGCVGSLIFPRRSSDGSGDNPDS